MGTAIFVEFGRKIIAKFTSKKTVLWLKIRQHLTLLGSFRFNWIISPEIWMYSTRIRTYLIFSNVLFWKQKYKQHWNLKFHQYTFHDPEYIHRKIKDVAE